MKEKQGYMDTFRTWLDYIDYQKLMFGTDWPLVNYEEYIDFMEKIDYQTILSHNESNTKRLLGTAKGFIPVICISQK